MVGVYEGFVKALIWRTSLTIFVSSRKEHISVRKNFLTRNPYLDRRNTTNLLWEILTHCLHQKILPLPPT